MPGRAILPGMATRKLSRTPAAGRTSSPRSTTSRRPAAATGREAEKKRPIANARMRKLLAAALAVRQRAYAPYSKFQVGAAILCDDGRLYAGCNVENSSYGVCLCAERNAIGQAIARGATRITAAAVVAPGPNGRPTPPCGMCLQAFSEFASGELPILLTTPDGAQEELVTLGQLLPYRFDSSYLP